MSPQEIDRHIQEGTPESAFLQARHQFFETVGQPTVEPARRFIIICVLGLVVVAQTFAIIFFVNRAEVQPWVVAVDSARGSATVESELAVCVRPSHLDTDDAEVQAAGFQRYGSSSAKAEAGCVGKRSRMSLRYSLATALISSQVSNDGLTVTTQGGSGQASTSSVAGQVLGDISQRILARNADIPPTITVPIGMNFNVVMTREVGLPEYTARR